MYIKYIMAKKIGGSTCSKTIGGKKRGTRKQSPYNKFMKIEIKKVKKENPSMDHKDAFKLAASNWSKR